MLIHMQQLHILFNLVQMLEWIFLVALGAAMEANSLLFQIYIGKEDKWYNQLLRIEKISKLLKCQSTSQMIGHLAARIISVRETCKTKRVTLIWLTNLSNQVKNPRKIWHKS